MGASKKTVKQAIFISIVNGSLAEYVGKEKKEKTHFEHKERFFEPYEEISGYLTYIGINEAGSESKKWQELQMRLSEEGEPDVLFKTSFPSREASEILNRLTTFLAISQDDYFIRLRAFKNDDGRTVVILRDRNEILIPRKFTKDEPNGLPEMIKKTNKKREVSYDHEAQDEFFEELAATMQKQVRENNMLDKTVGEVTEGANE